MERPRILFLLEHPPDARDKSRFGFTTLEKLGFEVHIAELSAIRGRGAPNAEERKGTDPWPLTCAGLSALKRFALSLEHHDTVIMVGGVTQQSLWTDRRILAILGRSRAFLAAISVGGMPALDAEATARRRVVQQATFMAVRPRCWPTLARRALAIMSGGTLAARQALHLTSIRPLEQIWAGTTAANIAPSLIRRSTSITPVHMLDFDLVLAAQASATTTGGVVFLDCMGPEHPDYALQGVVPALSGPDYALLIGPGLGALASATHSSIKIAAHPKASEGQSESMYPGREVVRGSTVDLIAQANVVACAEASTAIGMAVAMRKPLVIMTSSRFEPWVCQSNHSLIRQLNPAVIDLDCESPSVQGPLEVDQEAYSKFLERYMKRAGTPQKPFWDCVAEDIHRRVDGL